MSQPVLVCSRVPGTLSQQFTLRKLALGVCPLSMSHLDRKERLPRLKQATTLVSLAVANDLELNMTIGARADERASFISPGFGRRLGTQILEKTTPPFASRLL